MSDTVCVRIDNTTREFSKQDWEQIRRGEMDVDSAVLRYVIRSHYSMNQGLITALADNQELTSVLRAELTQALKRGNARKPKRVKEEA